MNDVDTRLKHFLAELERALDADDVNVLRHPAMRALGRGELPREGLQNWTRQFFHCIRDSARSFALVHANLPNEDLDLRRALAANIYEEDAGGISGTDNHNELFLRFAGALGLSREAVLSAPRGPEAAALMGEFSVRALTREQALEWLCIRGVGMEGPNARICAATGDALRKHYGLSAQDTAFFDVHAEVDEDHGEFALAVLRRAADTDARRADLRQKILGGARLFYRVWDTALRSTAEPG
jgi:pyrroloquinoline quinone (PQQ) biosynthesis protein C